MASTEAEVRVINTHLGELTLRIFGENGSPLAIFFPGGAKAVVQEWEPTALHLSKNGYQCCIINFHSNPKTVPGVMYGGVQVEDVAKIVNEAIFSEFQQTNAVLLGKSWGAYMASLYATAHPKNVVRLCLIAPAFTTPERVNNLYLSRTITFLGWAKDDKIMWFSNAQTWVDGMGYYLVKFQSPNSGGHCIVEEYAVEILNFLQKKDEDINFDREAPRMSSALVPTGDAPCVGEIRNVFTHLGEVQMRIVGKNTKSNNLIVCLPGGMAPLFHEWSEIAALLADKGYVVCVINFHSNPNTCPGIVFGGIQPDDVSRIINQTVMREVFGKTEAIIMGKSWGGFMAAQHASKHPDKVVAMLVQAPAFTTATRVAAVNDAKVRTFLGWAKDDPKMWYSASAAWLSAIKGNNDDGDKLLEMYTAEKGGHDFTPEYHEPFMAYIDRLKLNGNVPTPPTANPAL